MLLPLLTRDKHIEMYNAKMMKCALALFGVRQDEDDDTQNRTRESKHNGIQIQANSN